MTRRTPDSLDESGTDNEPDRTTATAHTESFSVKQSRDTKLPSMIERTAMFIDRATSILKDQTGSRRREKHIDTAIDKDFPIAKLGLLTTSQSGLSTIQPKIRPGLGVLRRPEEWTELEVTMDSGACISVMPESLCEGISIFENELVRAGAEYEVANGASIPNLGKRRCEVMTVGSLAPKRIVVQVAAVHKLLLSISGCADMGYDCFLGKHGGSLKDRFTGETIPLMRQGSLYTVRMWVRQDPKADQGDPGTPFGGPE